MKQKKLIAEYIGGAEGESAVIVDAFGRVLKTSTVYGITVNGQNVWIETKNSIYCTAKWFNFGGIESMLTPERGIDIDKENVVRYYDVDYDSLRDVGYHVQVTENVGNINAEEDCDARSIVNTLCNMFPSHFFLRQFCKVRGVYCGDKVVDYVYLYETARMRYIVEVSLLHRTGCYMRLYCCRK